MADEARSRATLGGPRDDDDRPSARVRGGARGGALAVFVAAKDPRLVALLPRLETPARDASILVHEDVRRNARVAAVVEWLAVVAEALR